MELIVDCQKFCIVLTSGLVKDYAHHFQFYLVQRIKYDKQIDISLQNIEEPSTKGSQKRTKERINVFRFVFRDRDL